MLRAASCPDTVVTLHCQTPPAPVSYDDLIELARLCLRQADATSNPTAAAGLRRMASEYQARAEALAEARTPDMVPIPESSPPAAQPLQQQPQPESPGGSEGKKPSD
jgi:hypothetical protein